VAVLGAVSSSRTVTLLAHGSPVPLALDGGYRLAFAIALGSVVVGLVVGSLILKGTVSTDQRPEGDDQSHEAVSETMIAEVL
jgi:hypothetical protein